MSEPTTPHDPAIKARAFDIWLWEADRNCAEVARRLAEEFPDHRTPAERTVYNWERDDEWDNRALEVLVNDNRARVIFDGTIGRLIVNTPRLLDQLHAITNLDVTDPKNRRDVIEASKVLLNLLDKATSSRVTPELAPAPTAALTEGRSRDEIAAAQLERIRRQRAPRKGKS